MPAGKIFFLNFFLLPKIINFILERIERCCKCCSRIPSSSLLAFVMLLCGLGLLTGSLITVGERLKKNDILNYNDL